MHGIDVGGGSTLISMGMTLPYVLYANPKERFVLATSVPYVFSV